jgi:hypothetical protein
MNKNDAIELLNNFLLWPDPDKIPLSKITLKNLAKLIEKQANEVEQLNSNFRTLEYNYEQSIREREDLEHQVEKLEGANSSWTPKYKIDDWCWFISDSTRKIAKQVRIKRVEFCCVVIEDAEFVFKIPQLDLYKTEAEALASMEGK